MQHDRQFGTTIRLGLILMLLTLAFLPQASPAIAKTEPDAYSVNFLPNNFFRLCTGDSHTYAFMVKWIEREDPDPVEIDENGLPVPVPLHVYKAKVTASHGIVEPSEFAITTDNQVFRVKYTAQSEGQESIQVTITDGATGQGAKSLQILGNCDYKISFFAKQRETIEVGGYEVVLQGKGNFSLDRTAADSPSITGGGNTQAALDMWAESQGLFGCAMVPFNSNSTFKTEGTLRPDYGFMTVSIYFDPFKFPGNMHFDCSALGLGELTIDVPVGDASSNQKSFDLVGLTFPITGGSDHFDFGKSQGVVVVTMKK